jgi:hypothetical protein
MLTLLPDGWFFHEALASWMAPRRQKTPRPVHLNAC